MRRAAAKANARDKIARPPSIRRPFFSPILVTVVVVDPRSSA